MEDWKSRVDRHWDKMKKEQEESIKRRYQKLLKKYQRRFKCHVCGIPDSGPTLSSDHWYWDGPHNLRYCWICKKLTCETHLYKEICAKCSKKL